MERTNKWAVFTQTSGSTIIMAIGIVYEKSTPKDYMGGGGSVKTNKLNLNSKTGEEIL